MHWCWKMFFCGKQMLRTSLPPTGRVTQLSLSRTKGRYVEYPHALVRYSPASPSLDTALVWRDLPDLVFSRRMDRMVLRREPPRSDRFVGDWPHHGARRFGAA